MKDIIATRNTGAGMVYIFVTAIGLLITLSGFGTGEAAFAVCACGVLITVACGYFAVQFLRTPSLIMWLDGEGQLCLPRGVVVDPCDILDVSYRRASARGIQYKWGSVTVATHLGTHKYGFVSECESVAKRLTELMHRAKHTDKDRK